MLAPKFLVSKTMGVRHGCVAAVVRDSDMFETRLDDNQTFVILLDMTYFPHENGIFAMP